MRGVYEIGRYELKYVLPVQARDEVLEFIAPHARPDPHARPMSDGALGYLVHSLYLDTPDLADYFERLERRPVRNRLRVRTYGLQGERHPVFLENKRKCGRWVVKHRVPVCDAETWCAAEESRPWVGLARRVSRNGLFAARSFCQLAEAGGRIPVSVVHYMREVFVPREATAGHVRLTLDRRIQAAVAPSASELYACSEVDLIPEDWMVMELKFDRVQPGWMRHLCRRLKIQAVPVTKFGLSVAKGLRAGRERELRILTPRPLTSSRCVA